MKKISIALFAVVVALASFAFTKADLTNYYWYKYNTSTSSFEFDKFDTAPTNPCSGSLGNCNRAFLVDPTDPNTATPNVEQKKL